VTWLLVAANVAVFIAELATHDIDRLVSRWALQPGLFAGRIDPGALSTLLTSAFLHAGVVHLAANMLYLIVFGSRVENRLGRTLFAILYITGAAAAGLGYLLAGSVDQSPVIGASGAVSAVLGAYTIFFPTARIRLVVPLVVVPVPASMPAWLFVAAWLASQISGLLSETGRIAWWGHLGGFAFGCFVAIMLGDLTASRRRKRR